MAERLIKIEYSGPGLYKVTSAASIQGALRAAMIRLYEEQYQQALVYDLRYGGEFGDTKCRALTLSRRNGQLGICWLGHKAPK